MCCNMLPLLLEAKYVQERTCCSFIRLYTYFLFKELRTLGSTETSFKLLDFEYSNFLTGLLKVS